MSLTPRRRSRPSPACWRRAVGLAADVGAGAPPAGRARRRARLRHVSWFVAQAYARAARSRRRRRRDRRRSPPTELPPARRLRPRASRSAGAAPPPRSIDALERLRVEAIPTTVDHRRRATPRSPQLARPPGRASTSPTSARSCRRGSRPQRSRCCARTSARTSSRRSPTPSAPLATPLPHDPTRVRPLRVPGPRLDASGSRTRPRSSSARPAQAHTESYPAMEYRHGPISVAGPCTPGVDPRHARPDDRRRRRAPPARPSGSGELDPMAELVCIHTDRRRARRGARSRPRPSAPPDPFGGAARGGNRMKRRAALLVVRWPRSPLVAAACTSDSGDTSSASGRRHVRRADRTHDVARLRQGDRQPGPDELRGQVAHRPRGRVQRDEPGHPREPRLHRHRTTTRSRSSPSRSKAASSRTSRTSTARRSPQLATAPGIMDLTDDVQDPSCNWDDFSEGARAAATVDGQVFGIPALIDNLAIVYNKDLFDAGRRRLPDRRLDLGRLRAPPRRRSPIPSKQQFGFAFPTDASEDTVWHYDAMLWEARRRHPERGQHAGRVQLRRRRAGAHDAAADGRDRQSQSTSTSRTPEDRRRCSTPARSAMDVTGPWALSGYPDVNYGVQIMPVFPGGSHATIAGPDMWVLFDNDGHGQAAWQFMQWLTAAQQVKAGLDGERPPADPELRRRRSRASSTRSTRSSPAKGCSRRT